MASTNLRQKFSLVVIMILTSMVIAFSSTAQAVTFDGDMVSAKGVIQQATPFSICMQGETHVLLDPLNGNTLAFLKSTHVLLDQFLGQNVRVCGREIGVECYLLCVQLVDYETGPCNCAKSDFDCDGDVDGSDLAVFASDFGRTNCLPFNPCAGDFDCDGDVDGSDLSVFAADFGLTHGPVSPAIEEYSNSGCLPGSSVKSTSDQYGWCDDDEIQAIVEGRTIYLIHNNATYNCCLDDIRVSLSAEGNMLRVTEEEVLTHPCYCLCCYNVEVTIIDLSPGSYVLEYCWTAYETGPECFTQEVVIP